MAAFRTSYPTLNAGRIPYSSPTAGPDPRVQTAHNPRGEGIPSESDPASCLGESVRLPSGRLRGFRGTGMYAGGYRGFSYRGGMW
ncbi:MAG: hypothetical protein U0794_14805 [Isosphaeraceae bacterium]